MDPATWAYLALLLASTGASYAGQRKTNRERAKVMALADAQRKKQSDRSEAAALNTANLYTGGSKEADRAAELAKDYVAPEATGPAGQSTPAGLLRSASPAHSTATVADINARRDVSRGFAADQAARLGKINSFGDVMLGNQIAAGRNAQDIRQSMSALDNWNQWVMPAQLNAANNAGADWQTAADVMKVAAAVVAPYALSSQAGQVPEVTAGDITKARFGDFASKGFNGISGGTVPFGSSYGLDTTAALVNPGSGLVEYGAGLVSSEARSRALWKYANGLPLSEAERAMVYHD